MRTLGFSTGALAKCDFLAGVAISRSLDLPAIELSALRNSELDPLLRAIDALPLDGFRHVSLHAPSQLKSLEEPDLIRALMGLPAEWPIIVHPDIISDFSSWRFLGRRLCIENMDQRKNRGRTVPELKFVFDRLPEAGFCFDIGHARQVDPTMGVAISMLQRFGPRLRQVHISEVDPQGRHIPIGFSAGHGFRLAAKLIPEDCPIIVESTIQGDPLDLAMEVSIVHQILNPETELEEDRGARIDRGTGELGS
ncbi:MAG TPA: TIM barrel protein [Thermoanaerobaculia bacterium]|nr:TIM barrel protein [Thermoanaerobaculia bacterium]